MPKHWSDFSRRLQCHILQHPGGCIAQNNICITTQLFVYPLLLTTIKYFPCSPCLVFPRVFLFSSSLAWPRGTTGTLGLVTSSRTWWAIQLSPSLHALYILLQWFISCHVHFMSIGSPYETICYLCCSAHSWKPGTVTSCWRAGHGTVTSVVFKLYLKTRLTQWNTS